MTTIALIPPIRAIVDLLKPVLVFFHDTVGVGWGMSIVLLTVCVRALLTPLMVKQFKSMKGMIAYAPQIKAVQEKYKDDKERQRQEVMKVYQENKINPFASCLPIVAQMPFFIGLYYLLRSDLRFEICGNGTSPCGEASTATGAEHFLFIPDLTDQATGAVLIVLIVLYIGSQLLSSVLTPSTGDRNAKMLMYGLPFFFVFIIIRFPAGLIVYWITTNLWTVGQGYILRKRLGPIKPADDDVPAPAKADESDGARKGLIARLMEATAAAKPPVSTAAKEPAAVGAKSGGSSSKSGGSSSKSGGSSSKSGGSSAKKPASAPKPARSGPPPKPPRKKKKRSGRRR